MWFPVFYAYSLPVQFVNPVVVGYSVSVILCFFANVCWAWSVCVNMKWLSPFFVSPFSLDQCSRFAYMLYNFTNLCTIWIFHRFSRKTAAFKLFRKQQQQLHRSSDTRAHACTTCDHTFFWRSLFISEFPSMKFTLILNTCWQIWFYHSVFWQREHVNTKTKLPTSDIYT